MYCRRHMTEGSLEGFGPTSNIRMLIRTVNKSTRKILPWKACDKMITGIPVENLRELADLSKKRANSRLHAAIKPSELPFVCSISPVSVRSLVTGRAQTSGARGEICKQPERRASPLRALPLSEVAREVIDHPCPWALTVFEPGMEQVCSGWKDRGMM